MSNKYDDAFETFQNSSEDIARAIAFSEGIGHLSIKYPMIIGFKDDELDKYTNFQVVNSAIELEELADNNSIIASIHDLMADKNPDSFMSLSEDIQNQIMNRTLQNGYADVITFETMAYIANVKVATENFISDNLENFAPNNPNLIDNISIMNRDDDQYLVENLTKKPALQAALVHYEQTNQDTYIILIGEDKKMEFVEIPANSNDLFDILSQPENNDLRVFRVNNKEMFDKMNESYNNTEWDGQQIIGTREMPTIKMGRTEVDRAKLLTLMSESFAVSLEMMLDMVDEHKQELTNTNKNKNKLTLS